MARLQKKFEKYRIIKELEESNYARVYKIESKDKKTLALKIARTDSSEHNELIAREFRVLSQFKHPNIVPVFDYDIADDDRAYFTLGFIPGKSISKYFKGISEEFISVILQVINGLGAFHEQGFVHTDLKPEHILYNPDDKKAVLIDFGFAGAATHDIKIAGTIGYMAPEVLKGISIDQRSDLYSLGVIIYEILSGQKLKESFVPVKDAPEEINNIIARLISKEPAIRPTIPELYHTFSKYLPSKKVELPSHKVALPETSFVDIPEIVDTLSAAMGKTFIITGDTGTGKTRLLQEMKYKYLMKGYSVLFHHVQEKVRFYEAIRDFINIQKVDFSNKADRFQIYEELTNALVNFAKDKNVAIIVDDLDDLSDYGIRLFRYLGYGIQNSNVLLIGTARVNEKISGLGFDTLSIRPLSEQETQILLEKTFFALGPEKEISKVADFARWLHKQSGGNPLFIIEILKTLFEERVIHYQANRWQINSERIKEIAVPTKIDDLLEARLKYPDVNELKILKILSIVDTPLEISMISLITESDASIWIERLKSFGLLREEIINERRSVYIPNQILAQLINKSIEQRDRESLHRNLIKTIEAVAIDDRNYLPVLARLCDEVGDKNKAYKYFESSAENAELIYDYDAALKYYERLAEYGKDIDINKYFEILVKLGDLNQIAGDNKNAIDFYNNALKSDNKDILAQSYTGLGKIYSIMGEYNKALEHHQKALNFIDSKTLDYIRTANVLGYALTNLRKFEEAEAIFDKSLHLAKQLKNVEHEARTLYAQVSIEWYRNDFEQGIKKAEKLLKFCDKNKLTAEYALTANLLGSFYQQMKDINMAQTYFDLAIEGFNRIRRIDALCTAMHNNALLLTQQGKLTQAKELFEKTLNLAQKTNNKAIYLLTVSNLALINSDLGRFEEAINLNKMILAMEPDYLWANYGLAMVYYKQGKLEKSKSILQEKLKTKEEILYEIGLALIDSGDKKAEELLEKGLNLIEKQNPDIAIKVESFLKIAQFHYERGDFKNALNFAKKVVAITDVLSKEYIIASAFIKINNFNLKHIGKVDITLETERLKEMGCIYNYAYLKKVLIESLISNGIKREEIKDVAEELTAIQEIFESIGARLELNRLKGLQERLFPIIIKDYSRRIISEQYLDTFSRIAELISGHLGDEGFVQNILDVVIKTTNAERGALFIKTPKGMDFVAGRDIDRTTIKDAGELSQTAIKQIEKNRIIFAQDALTDPAFNIKKSVMLNQIRSLLCIPLSVSGNIIGAVYLDSRVASGIFGPEDKDFLLTISKILASVIEKSMAFRSMTEENILLKSNIIKEIGSGHLMGKSRVMKDVYKLIDSVAETNSPVLILGETGTGKGMIARLIHLRSKKKDKKFLSINCGTIPETLLESELFGHKKGAFTGAISDKKGLLEEGEGGTIFLDEISNTSLEFQGKLLEAIEEKVIRRVGETTTRNIDVRFLFATNKDLEIEVEDSRFRRDLFYRINVFKIEVPPLRDRPNDIPLLAQFFLERYSKEVNKKIDGFTAEALQRLREYFWPGNVRELQNVIERAIVLAKGNLINLKDIGFEKVKVTEVIPLKEIKKEAIIEALNIANWNVKKAAQLLGIGRRTLHRYIKDYNITNNSTMSLGRR